MKENIWFFFLAVVLASCAASLLYRSDYPLTNTIVRSRDGTLQGKTPQGWFSETEDTLGSALMIWLIKEDFSATLTIKEIKLNQPASQLVEKQGLRLLAKLSRDFNDERMLQPNIDEQEFTIGEKKFCGYEMPNELKRIVVFSARGKYYVCEARRLKNNASDDVAQLFSAQQTFLSSLSY